VGGGAEENGGKSILVIEACGLLQICPRDILGPIFIEIIQRENRASVKATSPPSSAPLSATNSGVA